MSETLTRDNLIAGNFPQVRDSETIVAGAGSLVRGTVLGRITKGAASKANGGAGSEGANTGDGTLTLDSTTPILAGAMSGVYKMRIIRAAVAQVGTTPAVPAQLALATVLDPLGRSLGTFLVPASGSTAHTFSNQIKFATKEGSTPFVVGDGFDITIAVGTGKLKTVNSANLDGSEVPYGILLEAADASGNADVAAVVAKTGEFSSGALTFGGSDTAATHIQALRALGIYLKTTLSA